MNPSITTPPQTSISEKKYHSFQLNIQPCWFKNGGNLSWIERLKQQRFAIRENFLHQPLEAGCGVDIRYHREGFLGFSHGDETVLAVIYAN